MARRDRGIAADPSRHHRRSLWRLGLTAGLAAAACKPTAASPSPPAPAPVSPPAEAFDPDDISDAPFTDEECVALGTMRAADPAEPRSAVAYTEECIETTKTDPPWMRRTARCVLRAPSPDDRKRCFNQRLVDEREASAQRLEAQIEAQAERERAERLRRAEEILRESRQMPALTEPNADDTAPTESPSNEAGTAAPP